jgi:hypothetical protein
MTDNLVRAARTLLQALFGLIATGALSGLLESYVTGHPLDPTLYMALTLIATMLASWAQNMIEDKTGHALLGLGTKDREVGDQVLGTGLGAKMAASGNPPSVRAGRDFLIALLLAGTLLALHFGTAAALGGWCRC